LVCQAILVAGSEDVRSDAESDFGLAARDTLLSGACGLPFPTSLC
jgi:hypothetical protein